MAINPGMIASVLAKTPAVAAAAVGGTAALILGLRCFTVVPAGHVGVADTLGKVAEEPLQPGFHLKNPLTRVHAMSVKTQTMQLRAQVPTSEGLTVDLDAAVLYRLDPNRAVHMYRTVGPTGQYSERIVEPNVRATLRDLTARFEAKALYTKQRTRMAADLTTELKERLADRGIIVEDSPLKRITLPPTLSEAIQSKLEMEQQSQRMQFVLQRERQEAERKEIEARGIAKFQEIVTQGITPGVLQWKAIEATEKLAESENSKLVFIGNPKDGLPIMMGGQQSMLP